jgi:hypothetical protein
VSQHEHLTVVALRVYINNVWQPPQISRAISIPAQEICPLFHKRANLIMKQYKSNTKLMVLYSFNAMDD